MSKQTGHYGTWLCHTGCVLGQKDRGISGLEVKDLNSSQGQPKRTDRESRMRHATGNSSIQSFKSPFFRWGANLLLTLVGLNMGGVLSAGEKTSENKVYRQIGDAYEGLMLRQMYQAMKASTGLSSDNPFAPSNGEKIFQSMLDDRMLDEMSKNHPLGISDMVVRQLEGKGGVRSQGQVR